VRLYRYVRYLRTTGVEEPNRDRHDRFAEPEHELGRRPIEAFAISRARLDEDGVRRGREGRKGEQAQVRA
jgi:hypothetical protein